MNRFIFTLLFIFTTAGIAVAQCTISESLAFTNNGDGTCSVDITITNSGPFGIVAVARYGKHPGWPYYTLNTPIASGATVTVTTIDLPCADEFYLGIDGYVNGSCDCSTAGCNNLILVSGSLPVELTRFLGRNIDNNNVLEWSTASEENNAGFDVQRSFDGRNFEIIDFIDGHGTTDITQHYSYTDENITQRALDKTVYYRLKQIDYNGDFEFSEIIALEMDIEMKELEITRVEGINSEARKVNIHFLADENTRKIEITLSNISGSYLQRTSTKVSEFGFNLAEFDLANAPDGLYVVSINNGIKIITKKFVLQGTD